MQTEIPNSKLQNFIDLNKLPLDEFIHQLNKRSLHPEIIKLTAFDLCKNWYKVEWDGSKYVAV